MSRQRGGRAGSKATHSPSRGTWLLLGASALGVAAGTAAWLLGRSAVAELVWAATAVLGLVPLAGSVLGSVRRREPGVDLIALLAIGGAVALGEYLAGAVIALMLASGRGLEAYAGARAGSALEALLARAPRSAHRYVGAELEQVAVQAVVAGDRLLVRPGKVVPVDGTIASPLAVLDESALTGEPLPVERCRGERVRSGVANAGPAFDLVAVAAAAQSTYAGVVRLMEEARRRKAPIARLADRYALLLLPLTLLVAGGAWLASGDPRRGLAVLVVATPCPLLLAVPVALVSGVSRAARRGVIVKGGPPLERLAAARVLLLDKTGTLTAGRPRLRRVEARPPLDQDEVLRLAASLEQASPHVLAGAIVAAARQRRLALQLPTEVAEQAGAGVAGVVGGRRVAVGTATWAAADTADEVAGWAATLGRRGALDGATAVFVAVDGCLAGALLLDDPLRPDAARLLRVLRRAGIARVLLVSGDHAEVAESVGVAVGADQVLSERDPADKVDAVRAARRSGVTVMVGDGVNDAPALAAADIGVAMGARGATVASEAADVVLVADRLDRLADAMGAARRSRTVALQSALGGMALSVGAMVPAAAGWLAPVAGALLQEAIDVAAILNALRALGGGWRARRPPARGGALAARFHREHRELEPWLDRLRAAADRLEPGPGRQSGELQAMVCFLQEILLPHERREEEAVASVLAEGQGGDDPLGALRSTHLEIAHLARRYARLLASVPADGLDPETAAELRRTLYGLEAILRLHVAQEEVYARWVEPTPLADERNRP